MEKPTYLYHGSTIKLSIVKPHKATELSNENGNLFGVYANASFDMARRFAMPIEPVNHKISVTFEESGKIILNKGVVDKESSGYVYTLPSDSFIKIDDHRWISLQSVVPIECTEVYTKDIWDDIEFADGSEE